MLSKQEANEYYKDEAERYRTMADEEQRRRLHDYMQQMQSQIYQKQQEAQVRTYPTVRAATRAVLATDGIVIESAGVHIVVRGDLLKTLAVLVTMAQMAGLLAKDDEPGV